MLGRTLACLGERCPCCVSNPAISSSGLPLLGVSLRTAFSISAAEDSRAREPTVTGSVAAVASPPLQRMRTWRASGAERWATTLSIRRRRKAFCWWRRQSALAPQLRDLAASLQEGLPLLGAEGGRGFGGRRRLLPGLFLRLFQLPQRRRPSAPAVRRPPGGCPGRPG